ncbi:hypothetical protein HMPREF0758_0564 [Serratia odorifera DSM 4582]|uniref:Uncharacterized protein n=1 Tax=Serratia odorifera DSM 4582 TaxID=667129 RepID=D4DXB4_SEROD|nr:hypothetical protein HMPREF0758_0564 [Serratia odorifera DSM 4582]
MTTGVEQHAATSNARLERVKPPTADGRKPQAWFPLRREATKDMMIPQYSFYCAKVLAPQAGHEYVYLTAQTCKNK